MSNYYLSKCCNALLFDQAQGCVCSKCMKIADYYQFCIGAKITTLGSMKTSEITFEVGQENKNPLTQ